MKRPSVVNKIISLILAYNIHINLCECTGLGDGRNSERGAILNNGYELKVLLLQVLPLKVTSLLELVAAPVAWPPGGEGRDVQPPIIF